MNWIKGKTTDETYYDISIYLHTIDHGNESYKLISIAEGIPLSSVTNFIEHNAHENYVLQIKEHM